MGLVFRAEYAAGDHVLTRYVDKTHEQVPFADGALISVIYSGTIEEPCGFAVAEGTGVLLVDVPTAAGIVTRQTLEFGNPGSWTTVGV
ncbi:hypothetical protein LCGC14_1922010 [marine sediment metagenome]|uniref:Uncharacterized protein n=1 Tax=marine sediment metagenome TaxID=412755 RepID=A0A0F9IN79_9ZZZZ